MGWMEKKWLRWSLLNIIHLASLFVPSVIVWTGNIYWDQDDMVLLYAGLQGFVLFYISSLFQSKFFIAYLFNLLHHLVLALLTGSVLVYFGRDRLWTYFSGCEVPTNTAWYMVESHVGYLPVSTGIGAILGLVRWSEATLRSKRCPKCCKLDNFNQRN